MGIVDKVERLTEDEVRKVVQESGLPEIFVKIAEAESGWDPNKVTLKRRWDDGSVVSRSYGLFQIDDYYFQHLFEYHDWRIPADNAWMATQVYNTLRFDAWGVGTTARKLWNEQRKRNGG